MVFEQGQQIKNNDKKSERGAALVTVVIVSTLLIIVGSSILLVTSLFASIVTDSVSEQQAYYAAESGLQTTLNVLRGNVQPNPSFGNTEADRINYRKAVETNTSNLANDPSNFARLSRWINYNYTPPGASAPDRITIGSGNYAPMTGTAFNVGIFDPDNSRRVSFIVTANIDGGGSSKTWSNAGGSGVGTATVAFNGSAGTNLDTMPNGANSTFGAFRVTTTGLGAAVPNDTRFIITIEMTAPYNAKLLLRGTLKAGIITNGSTGSVDAVFDSEIHNLFGGLIDLNRKIYDLNPPNQNNGLTDVLVTIGSPEPQRLLIRSTGFGPRGSRKQIEMIVRNNPIGSLRASATITLAGTSTSFLIETGNSNNRQYSGNDVCTDANVPAFGVTNTTNLNTAIDSIRVKNNTLFPLLNEGGVVNISAELPDWHATTQALDNTIRGLRDLAKSRGTYFATGQAPNTLGSFSQQKGITFIEGDASLSQSGGGILVVTGKLTFRGGFDFKGLIIVTGAGGLERNGGGNGRIEGAIFVLPYNPNNLGAGFLSPRFETNGGGNSEIIFNSCAATNALNSANSLAIGVVEK